MPEDLADTLRRRANHSRTVSGDFLVYGPKEAAEDLAAAAEIERLRAKAPALATVS